MSRGAPEVSARPPPESRPARTRATTGHPYDGRVDRRPSHPRRAPRSVRRRPEAGAANARAAETLGALCLLGVAATHLLDVGHKLEEAPYMGAAFIVLIGGSIAAALLLLDGRRAPIAWRIALALSLGAIVGYLLSRSIGLPQLADHVGRWADPAGLAALTFEVASVLLATGAVARIPSDRMAPAAFSLAVGVLGLAAVAAGAAHPHGTGGHGEGHHGAAGTHEAGARGLGGHGHGHGGHPVGHAPGPGSHPSVFAAHGHGAHADVPQYPDLSQATPEQRAEARRLWLTTKKCTAEMGVGTVGAAQGLGYRVSSRTGLWHLTNPSFRLDDIVLDASRPAWNGGHADGCRVETLVYANPSRSPDCRGCRLVAAVYRLPTPQVPKLGGPIIRWHAHEEGNGLPMTHVWFTDDLRSAYAFKAPQELRLQ